MSCYDIDSTGESGIATASTVVDMSTSLFPEVVPEIDANPEH